MQEELSVIDDEQTNSFMKSNEDEENRQLLEYIDSQDRTK